MASFLDSVGFGNIPSFLAALTDQCFSVDYIAFEQVGPAVVATAILFGGRRLWIRVESRAPNELMHQMDGRIRRLGFATVIRPFN